MMVQRLAHDWVALKLKGSLLAHLKETMRLMAFLKQLVKETPMALV